MYRKIFADQKLLDEQNINNQETPCELNKKGILNLSKI